MMGRWTRAAGEIFLDWLALPPGLRWLDVGCGTGAFTELVLERCKPPGISAVDPAETRSHYARTKPVAQHVNFQVGDAQSLPFRDGEFDVAAMALVISFVPDPAKAVAEMKRVVKPGGTLGTYMWDFLGNGSTQQPLREAIEAMGVAVPPLPGHVNSTRDSLQRIFRDSRARWRRDAHDRDRSVLSGFRRILVDQTALANTVVAASSENERDRRSRKSKAICASICPRDRSGRIAYKARPTRSKAACRDKRGQRLRHHQDLRSPPCRTAPTAS